MNSATLPSFWRAYEVLDEEIKRRARRAYRLWAQNPFHPSLRFKCINRLEGDTVTWFWVGSHDDYERFFS
jgi:hypothetical protein